MINSIEITPSVKKLSDVAWEDLYVGMELVSSLTNWTGKVVHLVPNDDDCIWIDWDNGRESQVYHAHAQNVVVLESSLLAR